jgi:RNA polymerase sigma-70 factor (sigma-E family)
VQPFGGRHHQEGVTDEREGEYLAYVTARAGWLRRVAYLLTHNWDSADELVQATITRLYVHWRRARHADDLDAYVRRMLVNGFLEERRSRWGIRLLRWPAPPDTAVEPPDVDTVVTVRAALAGVPPRQRTVLVLRYYCDLSIADTATALGCSEGTVKSLTWHGLSALRRLLGQPVGVGNDER